MKISISKGVNIDLFCKNPMKILQKTDIGTIEILKNNTPVFYVVTPDFFNNVFYVHHIEKNKKISKENISIQKFPMHDKWTPDKDFIRQSALWGIYFTEEASTYELAYFISYWKAEGCFFHHVQWQQKLARSLQKSRLLDQITKNKRDITHIPTPDQKTPIGFRGE